MPVILLASSKGGVGKSTTSLVLATTLAEGGIKTALIDADPNAPLVAWKDMTTSALPNEFTLVSDVAEDNVIDVIDAAAETNSFVIVDVEGSANVTVSYAIGRADLVLIPLQGSQLDANEAAKVIRLIKRESKAYKREIPFVAVRSRTSYIKPRTALHVFNTLEEAGIDLLPTEMVERDAFKALFTYGGTLYDLSDEEVSNPQKAIDNAEALVKAVLNHLKGLGHG